MTAPTDRIAEVLRQKLGLEDFSGDQLYEGTINPRELAQRIAEALRPDRHTVAMAIRKAAGGSYTWEKLAEAAIEACGRP